MAQPGGLAEEHHERLRELAERMKAYTSRKADLQAAADMVQKGQAVPLRHGTIEASHAVCACRALPLTPKCRRI